MDADHLCEDIMKLSLKIVQARYRRRFNFNQFPKLIKNFKAIGTCEDHRAMASSPCDFHKI